MTSAPEAFWSMANPTPEVRPDEISYTGPAEALRDVWIAVRANLRDVLENVTVADLASGSLPPHIKEIVSDPEAWAPR